MFVALSGIAGAVSWLFYFMALKYGKVSQVAPIDKLSVVFAVILGILLFGKKVSFLHAGRVLRGLFVRIKFRIPVCFVILLCFGLSSAKKEKFHRFYVRTLIYFTYYVCNAFK